jgi:hypothetical protein
MTHRQRNGVNKMTTAAELIDTAPENQVMRSKLIYKAIAQGGWDDAIHYLENAVREEGDSPWGMDAADLLAQCRMNAK